ncbi:MAG TPA: alpha/beta hydrolase [Thermoanaerobaculia bacterium]|nr:alpha/beta hydrolase [Thermoanaerobaculia bacterium]
MKRFLVRSVFVVSIITSQLHAQSIIDGFWTGAGQIGDERTTISITFRSESGGVRGFLDHPDTGMSARELTGISINGRTVRFVLPVGSRSIPFEATVSGGSMTGTFRFGTGTVPFTLTRRTPEARPYREEPVTWQNGDVTLSGTLLLPEGKAPHGAVILQHAAYADTREEWRFYADHFARRGVAALIYDNRGAGQSSGDYRATFEQLASDAATGANLLAQRSDINARKIGLFAVSEGGWIAPIVATRSKDIAFVIVISAPAVTVAENIQYESETRLRDAGAKEDEIRDALALKRTVMQMIASRAPDEKIDALIATQKTTWANHIGLPGRKNWRRTWFPSVLNFDPVPLWQEVRVPVLAIYGSEDKDVRVSESAPLLERAMRSGGNGDVTIKVFPGADHGILTTSKAGRPLLAPGFMETMTSWLLAHVSGSAERSQPVAAASVAAVPAVPIDPKAKYVVYFHPRFPPGSTDRLASVGYDYDGILAALRAEGFTVVSEVRPQELPWIEEAEKAAPAVRKLLDAGVPASHVTLAGLAKGAVIALMVGARLGEPDIRIAGMSTCSSSWAENEQTTFHSTRFVGHILLLDDTGKSPILRCGIAGATEKQFSEGKGIALFLKPHDVWVKEIASFSAH